MNWDQAQIERFTDLRQRQLTGLLSEAERVELAAMLQAVEQAEAAQLAGTMATMQAEATGLQTKLQDLRQENQELAQLQIQLHLLLTDARLFSGTSAPAPSPYSLEQPESPWP